MVLNEERNNERTRKKREGIEEVNENERMKAYVV